MTDFKLMVDYPAELDLDATIEEIVGQQFEGAGSGFGRRDMDFFFDDDLEAHNAAARVRAAYPEGSGVFASVYDPREDE